MNALGKNSGHGLDRQARAEIIFDQSGGKIHQLDVAVPLSLMKLEDFFRKRELAARLEIDFRSRSEHDALEIKRQRRRLRLDRRALDQILQVSAQALAAQAIDVQVDIYRPPFFRCRFAPLVDQRNIAVLDFYRTKIEAELAILILERL